MQNSALEDFLNSYSFAFESSFEMKPEQNKDHLSMQMEMQQTIKNMNEDEKGDIIESDSSFSGGNLKRRELVS